MVHKSIYIRVCSTNKKGIMGHLIHYNSFFSLCFLNYNNKDIHLKSSHLLVVINWEYCLQSNKTSLFVCYIIIII